jgi:transposase InsO family protein
VTRFIEERRSVGIELVCETLGVGVSTHYDRLRREPSVRARRDAKLELEIIEARSGFRRVYGATKTWHQLMRTGIDDIGRDRVRRVMRATGWRGVTRGKNPRTTIAGESLTERARDLVDRDFTARAPNRKWVADFTYVRCWNGFAYFAFVKDVYSRMIVGWQLARHMRAELVTDALDMAYGLRLPPPDLIAHNDMGVQYTSVAYTERLVEYEMLASVGSRGDAYDNAMAETFVGLYKTELVAGRTFASFEQLEHETAQWIAFFNQERLHEELGYRPPAEYEILHPANQATPSLT